MPATIKKSRQRDAILECVLSRHDHPTADTIYMEVRKEFPHISLGTVYRNLSLLSKMGKIKKISCEDRTDRFDSVGKPHSHFICDRCGCLLDLPYSPDSSLCAEMNAAFDGQISECNVVFRGLCSDCMKKGQAPA